MPGIVTHSIKPVFDQMSKVLILGTMPSPKSREYGFFYGHPQNKFWKVLSDLHNEDLPFSIESKIAFLQRYHIALWDVLASCEITGADDNTIRNPVPNDLNVILRVAPIQAIFTTGRKAYELYNRFCFEQTKMEAIPLPSTSPANCRYYKYDDLLREYQKILEYL